MTGRDRERERERFYLDPPKPHNDLGGPCGPGGLTRPLDPAEEEVLFLHIRVV